MSVTVEQIIEKLRRREQYNKESAEAYSEVVPVDERDADEVRRLAVDHTIRSREDRIVIRIIQLMVEEDARGR